MEVLEFRKKTDRQHDLWLRRQAVQIASQLPESEADALAILKHAESLIREFLGEAGTSEPS